MAAARAKGVIATRAGRRWRGTRRPSPRRRPSGTGWCWGAGARSRRRWAAAHAAIHKAGIVHGDLPPQNLLRMGDGRVVLTDFGLATDTRDGTTSVHGGTISYMAPELLRGGHSSFGSDLWALGVVIYEIVFGGKPPWREGRTPEVLPPVLVRQR